MKIRKIRNAIMTAALIGAISCGVAVPSANAVAPAQVGVIVSAQTYSDSFTKRTFDLINAERAKVGARPFVWNQKIADVSQDWANKLGIATKDPKWDIANIHRPDAGGSLIPPGYTGYRENIAFNFSPEQIVDWWMNSPGHKASMLNPNLTDAGLGYVVPTSGPYAGWHLMVSNMAAYPTTQAPPPAPSTSVTAGSQYKTAIWLNLRSGPSTSNTIIGSGVQGTIVTATGRTSGIWYEVKLDNQTGWMSSDYLTKYSNAPVTQTPLAIKAAQIGGALGSPTGSEVYGLKDGGSYRMYERGALIYSPTTGARVSMGGIRSTWAGTGFENGFLGYPTTDEVGGLKNGGVYQNYQGGSIHWSPQTGAHFTTGGIRNTWAAAGYENGVLGYPTSNEVGGLKNGGVYQNFQGGSIIWSPTTGAAVSFGGIRTLWASQGYESGRLGYPIGNEYVSGPGGAVAQNYQGGVIHWTPSASWISYK